MTLEAGPEFEELVDYLRESRGVDFSGYKRASLVRRVAKRCGELGIDDFPAYLDYLQVHSDEVPILFDKILINVTEFFRDRPAWDYLAEKIIPGIIAKPGPIRVWSAGTASGEEAYSAAIMFCEAMGPDALLSRVKIYATDIDDEALNRARTGYSAKEIEGLDENLRTRYFEQHGPNYTFQVGLRRILIFGRHDVMQDAPISRLDLLICRNTLMYFTSEAQGRILTRFHYALKDDGCLFVGRAEMLLTHSARFVPVDLKHRIFSKVVRMEPRDRLNVPPRPGSTESTDHSARQLHVRDLALEAVPFPQVVLDAEGTLISANAAARPLLRLSPGDVGRPLKDLEISYKPADLRTPIDRAHRERRTVVLSGVEFDLVDGARKTMDIQVAPIGDADRSVVGVGITFIDVTELKQLRSELDRSRQDVETAYEELQSSYEELETTNEELQSTVEELETTNEELQSSNEELETINEELESTNAELQSVNNDLHMRSDEVARLNTLLQAITGNIEVGAVVLDGDQRVLIWNERAADLWGLRSEEVVGKPFFELDIGLPSKDIRGMSRSVSAGKPKHDEIVVEAMTRRGKTIRCRVMTYTLSDGDRPSGVVIIMEELSEGKPA